jgi:catechol 2,3-dioxygenase-like lactoylglutathione lyase family enzyme
MIRDYQHVSITVGNLERSVAFYRDMLGFEVTDTAEQAGEELSKALDVENASLKLAVLQHGKVILELIEYLSPGDRNLRAPRPCDVGCMHMALDVEDIHTLYEDLSAQGVKFNTPPNRNPEEVSWAWWCYMQDPDGVPIELVQIAP